MRIINGKYSGRNFVLNIPYKTTRPTSNFAKEGLLNILKNRVDFSELYVLDLFAGIGSVGFEFSSLDVLEIKMVEMNPLIVEFLKKINRTLKAKNVKIEQSEVFKFLENDTAQYHIVFADPPYNFLHYEQLINIILEKNILFENGYFILEHYKKLSFKKMPFFVEVRNYGDASFSFFKK